MKTLQPKPSLETGKIKILYFIDQLSLGGTERHLVQTLKYLNRERFDPHVYVLHGRFDLLQDIELLDIPVKIWDIPNIVSLRGLFRFWSIVKSLFREKFDIIHTFLFTANIYGIMAAKIVGIPIRISTRRELVTWKKWHHRLASRVSNWCCQSIIANSKAVKAEMQKVERAPGNKIKVLHNGVDVESFVPQTVNGAFRKHLKLDDDVTLVVNVARYRAIKGQKYFVEACHKVAQDFPQTRFAIAGPVYDSNLKRELEKQTKRLEIDTHFFFLPTWKNPAELYKGSDIIVLSSLEEGFPNVVIEAMAAGKPVVASNVGGVVEAIDDGVTGYLTPRADSDALASAISKLVQHKSLAARMGKQANLRVNKKFHQRIKARELEEHYFALLSKIGIIDD